MISCSSSTASSAPATSAKVVLGVSLAIELRLRLAEVEHPAAAALHLRHEQQQQDDEDRDRQQVDQEAQQDAVLRDLVVEVSICRSVFAVHGRRSRRRPRWVLRRWTALDLVDRSVGCPLTSTLFFRSRSSFCSVSSSTAFFTLPVAHLRERVRCVDLGVLLAAGEEAAQRDRADDHQDDPHHRPAEDATGTFHAVLSALVRPALPISQNTLQPRRTRGSVAASRRAPTRPRGRRGARSFDGTP